MSDFDTIDDALEDMRKGKMVVVLDDEDRENEGDLILAAEMATPESIAFMVRYTSGVICVATTEARLQQLGLPQMVPNNEDPKRTAFTISLDYRKDTTTGISASDRAKTIRAMANPACSEKDFTRPGHIFPLRYHVGGVLRRCGHTEASVDLSRLAGLYPAGALCELVKDDGEMMRFPDCKIFAKTHGLKMITIADLIKYRFRRETLVKEVNPHAASDGKDILPVKAQEINTPYGPFVCQVFESVLDKSQHIAMVKGNPRTKGVAVRVQLESLADDVFGYNPLIRGAMSEIEKLGCGIIVYLRGMEGKGVGIVHHDAIEDTDIADKDSNFIPNVGIGAQILAALGVTSMNILTNNNKKYPGLDGFGLEVVGRLPIPLDAPFK